MPRLLARDQAILRDIAAGLTYRELARTHHISQRSIAALKRAFDVRIEEAGSVESAPRSVAPARGSTHRPAAAETNLVERVVTAVSEQLDTSAAIARAIGETDWMAGQGSVGTLLGLVEAAERMGASAAQLISLLRPTESDGA